MITHDEFTRIMERMELATETLEEKKVEVYFDLLKGQDFVVLRKAVTILLENYKYKRFPPIAEIKDACKDAAARIAWAINKESCELEGKQECGKCRGMGWVTVEYFEPLYRATHEKAVNCSCWIGRNRMAAWKRDPNPDSPVMGERVYERAGD